MNLFDVVFLKKALPGAGLRAGQRGVIVELLQGGFEVEFFAEDGETVACIGVRPEQLLAEPPDGAQSGGPARGQAGGE